MDTIRDAGPGGVATEPQTLEETCVDKRTPLNEVLDSERAMEVRNGIRRLREMDRQAIHAIYMDGQSLIEMSDQFDAPVGTIKRRLHVARHRRAKEKDTPAAV